jgi:hypothetical protein
MTRVRFKLGRALVVSQLLVVSVAGCSGVAGASGRTRTGLK